MADREVMLDFGLEEVLKSLGIWYISCFKMGTKKE